MKKALAQFEPTEVTKALEAMGIPKKEIHDGKNLLRFIDDQDKCREFCGKLQGEAAVKRDDQTFMGRYQARAERIIRTFNKMPIPSDLDVNKETYKENDMGKSATKKKEPKAAHAAEGKTKKPKLAVVNENEPKWFGKFARRGIAFRMAVLMHRVEGEAIPGEDKKSKVTGATKAEMLEDLVASFPDHEESSLKNNISVEISSLQNRLGKKITRTEDEKRGLVYSIK